MIRPCFLVIDREFPGSISTRKLVLETAKFNVLTAYSGREAMDIFLRFPLVDGVVMDGELDDIPASDLARQLKSVQPNVPIVIIKGLSCPDCDGADFILESFNPAKLLETLRELKLAEAEQIERRDKELSRERLD